MYYYVLLCVSLQPSAKHTYPMHTQGVLLSLTHPSLTHLSLAHLSLAHPSRVPSFIPCSSCRVGTLCQNRRFQKGDRASCELFKTERKGWGLKAKEDIQR